MSLVWVCPEENAMDFFRKHCCKIAIAVAITAILLVTLIVGYDVLDWAIMSWVGAAIVVVAAWLCMKCRDSEENPGDRQ